MNLYADAQTILREAIAAVQPEAAVTRALARSCRRAMDGVF